MSLRYVDTSALVRAYVADEPDHEQLRALLVEAVEPVVSSELSEVELASAVTAAVRHERLHDGEALLSRFRADYADGGPVTLLRLDSDSTLPLAYRIVREHHVRTLDAIHLAVALTDAPALAAGETVTMVTRDSAQARAARSLGLEVA